jgi:cytohesin
MWAAGVGIWNIGESAGTNEEALAAVKVALETGADVNAVDDRNETALHGAAYRGANEVVKLLVEKGANLNVKNENAWTPLVITEGVFYPNTFQRRLDTAELLRKLGAEPSPPDVPRRVIRGKDPG